MPPDIVFGMTLYNNARHLPQAIESLLAQRDAGFGVVMVDDGSGDGTEEIARGYVARDPRLRYLRHATRRGMVPTWREAVDAARREFPSARAFAWASDHDWWHPDWLARMREALHAHPGAVLAYPITQRVDDELRPVDKPPKAFDTTAIGDPAARVLAFAREPAGAGDMVYGLMRLDAVLRTGVFRPVLQPDRLLMIELALQGPFVQVPEVLWLRRQPQQASVTKQHTTLFAPGEAPPGLGAPVWLQHGRVLVRDYVHQRRVAGMSPTRMLGLVVHYLLIYQFRHHAKEGQVLHRLDNAWERVEQETKEQQRSLRWAVYRAQRGLSPVRLAKVVRKHALHLWHQAIYRAAMLRRRSG